MKESDINNSAEVKKQIYYSRTYRHMKFNRKTSLIFLLGFVLPLTVLLFLFYDEFTYLMCYCARWFLNSVCGIELTMKTADFIPFLGHVHYIDFSTKLPEMSFVLANAGISLLLILVLSTGKLKGKPISIYLDITLLVHIIGCVFFLLSGNKFGYTVSDYSQLYVQQQVGIWMTFVVLIGLVEGILNKESILYRIMIVLSVLAYSVLFGIVRYALFLLILNKFSVLYMPVMFFTLGPFFDFMYFVMIYSISTNHMIKKIIDRKNDQWQWA